MSSDKYITVIQKLGIITNNKIAEHNQFLNDTTELINSIKEDMITMENDINNFSDNHGEQTAGKSKCMLDELKAIRKGVELNEAKVKVMLVPQDNKKDEEPKEVKAIEYSETSTEIN